MFETYFRSSSSLWNNSLISISILRDYWLETMRFTWISRLKHVGGFFLPFVFTVQRLVFVLYLKKSFVDILKNYRRTMKINSDA